MVNEKYSILYLCGLQVSCKRLIKNINLMQLEFWKSSCSTLTTAITTESTPHVFSHGQTRDNLFFHYRDTLN